MPEYATEYAGLRELLAWPDAHVMWITVHTAAELLGYDVDRIGFPDGAWLRNAVHARLARGIRLLGWPRIWAAAVALAASELAWGDAVALAGPARRDRTATRVARRSPSPAPLSAPDGPVVSVARVAEMLGLARCTVYRMLDDGQLPHHLVRGLRRIALCDVDEYLARSRISSALEVESQRRATIHVLRPDKQGAEAEGRAAAQAFGLVPGGEDRRR